MLAALLLASLAWASTVEFTHHHATTAQTAEYLSNTAQSSTYDGAISKQISSSNTNGKSSNSKSGADCLICRLQQNLSAAAIGYTPGVGSTATHGLSAPLSPIVKLSEFTSTGHGRAPPSIL